MMPAQLNSNRVSLQYLLDGMAGVADMSVGKPSVDARSIEAGGLFLAVKGSQSHGLTYAEQAISAGASVIVYDLSDEVEFLVKKIKKEHDVYLVALPNLNARVSDIAARFYQHPSRNMTVVGITGTNGKTSVSHFIGQALNDSCGVIGTLGWGRVDSLKETVNTTPDGVSVQQQMACLLDDGCDSVAMEVSSHGLDQGRVKAVEYKGAVFTNLSHDHLDYHQTMDAYGEAKLALFRCASLEFVVLNADDAFSAKILDVLSPAIKVFTFSRIKENALKENCLFISNEQLHTAGLSFDVSLNGVVVHVESNLYGSFNVENLVSTMAVIVAMGQSLETAAESIQKVSSVAGRMQLVSNDEAKPTVVVDYAHTPDALKLALAGLREHCSGQLTVVFGCGGNRDEAKRPLMGAIAAELADTVIVTNDNPRFEAAEKIATQIQSGVSDLNNVSVVLDREQAIEQAIVQSKPEDIVLIAGKGHEAYQYIGDEKIAFSDVGVAKAVLNGSAEVKV